MAGEIEWRAKSDFTLRLFAISRTRQSTSWGATMPEKKPAMPRRMGLARKMPSAGPQRILKRTMNEYAFGRSSIL